MGQIAFISTFDSREINSWSGTPHYIAKSINKHIGEVDFIGNLKYKKYLSNISRNIFYSIFQNKSFLPERTEKIGKYFSNQVSKELSKKNYKFIISMGVIPIAYLKTDIPIIIIADANFHSMIDYYFKNLCKVSIEDGDKMELMAYNKSLHIVFSSEWAANTAVDFYGLRKDKVSVIPFGANIDIAPDQNILKKDLNTPLELLFIGKEWERKGGDIVLDTFYLLNKNNIPANLTIIGTNPPNNFKNKNIHVYNFLNKNSKNDRIIFEKLLLKADIFFMPSREECYGIVFCESNAYGIPCLSSDTGGISTIIKNGINGYLLPENSPSIIYTEKIINIIKDKKTFMELRNKTRKRYDESLNWDYFGCTLAELINKLI
jgi:glycosyltransferase involved in cell wall biosynthesis